LPEKKEKKLVKGNLGALLFIGDDGSEAGEEVRGDEENG
jgi:hypothetical protein